MAETFEITGQTEHLTIGPDGRPVQVVTVTFRTKPSMVFGTVDIAREGYTAELVEAAVVPRAAELERVALL